MNTDFLVIGSGIAGLIYAIEVAKYGKVAIVTKKKAIDSNTNVAQGGIASVAGSFDSFKSHIQDTIRSGGGICKREAVKKTILSGPSQIKKLIKMGIKFSKSEYSNNLDLGREGGHSQNRIIHAQDITGHKIEKVLLKKAKNNPNIFIFEHHMAIDLIVDHIYNTNNIFLNIKQKNECYGAYVLNRKTGNIKSFQSKITLMASGGIGSAYLHTSNPDIATGDGIAMGYRAGAALANLEFVQFHPTCLYTQISKNFLISEAVRGEGGVLINSYGKTFMQKYDPLKDLACRDIVARAIDTELKHSGQKCIFLDISHKKSSFIKKRFPNLYKKCISYSIDMTKDPIPVVPAAHYMCGGILTDKYARTTVKSLYAIGETACTGLHGANRLASNSLLEALVYADSAAKQTIKQAKKTPRIYQSNPLIQNKLKTNNKDELIMISHNWNEIRHIMWNYVGIIRSNKRLSRAKNRIFNLQKEIKKYYFDFKITGNLTELRNIALVSELIIKCACMRKESRGAHYSIEYPKKDDLNWKIDTIIRKST